MEVLSQYTPQFSCRDCPARFLRQGEFNVVDADDSFDYARGLQGYRVDSNHNPTCIHPHKIGLDEQEAVNAPKVDRRHDPEVELATITITEVAISNSEVPVDELEFFEWLVRRLYDTRPEYMDATLDAIHRIAGSIHPEEKVIEKLRDAFIFLETLDEDVS